MKKSHLAKTVILTGSLLLQLGTLSLRSHGAAGDVDLSFDPGSGVNGQVTALAVQPDGKVIIAGPFTTVKGLARSTVARLNADGSGDSSFAYAEPNPVFSSVWAIALQSDGKVLVGHLHGIHRLNPDGHLDTTFSATLQPFAHFIAVYSVAVQTDGKVLIGGNFSTVNGTDVNHGIARLNANGILDSTFNPGTGANDIVHSMALQPDGKVLIGGQFTQVNRTNRNGIARLNANGSLDSVFDPGTGAGGWVYSVALQPDGKVLLAGEGDFSTVNGANRIGIARLNSNGGLDSSFDAGAVVAGDYQQIFSVAVQSDGKVLVAGSFAAATGTNSTHGIIRLNANGSPDASFNPGTGVSGVGNYTSVVKSLVLQTDGKVLMGGPFTAVNGTNRNRVARLNTDGSLDGSFHPGTEVGDTVLSLVVQPDGKVLVGMQSAEFSPPAGAFTFVNGTNRYGSARLDTDGSLDSTFISSTNFHPDLAAFIVNDGCDSGYASYHYVVPTAVLLQADGKVLIGGYVQTTCNSGESGYEFSSSFLARYNADGSRDPSFNWGDIGFVSSIAQQPDGKLLLGGIHFAGTNQVARLNADGSLDNSFNAVTGGYSHVDSVALQSDGKVLIGGNYILVNGTNRNGIARLNADGSPDGSFNPGTGVGTIGDAYNVVSSIVVQSDGKVLIGGHFATVNGSNRNNIARLNAGGSLDTSFNPGTGADGLVRSIALQSDGNVLIGGDFTTVNGVVRPRVARLYGDSVAPSPNIARSNASVIVSWPVTGLNLQLQENTDLSLPNDWSPVAQPAVTNAGQISVTVPITVGQKFFRLKSQ